MMLTRKRVPRCSTKEYSRCVVLPRQRVQYGCVSFFCTQTGGDKLEGKSRKERREDESQEDQTGAKPTDATGERRTARCAGDEPMEERAPARDVGRDRNGGG